MSSKKLLAWREQVLDVFGRYSVSFVLFLGLCQVLVLACLEIFGRSEGVIPILNVIELALSKCVLFVGA